jgi:plasmid stability protein
MVQIRNMPDDVHRTLKVRAAEQGVSLSDYLLRLAERDASRPTIEELTRRIRARGRARSSVSAAEAVRELRDETG